MKLKTKRRIENEKLWGDIYGDFLRLYRGGAMKMPVYGRLAKKYSMHPNTIMRIVHRQKEEDAA